MAEKLLMKDGLGKSAVERIAKVLSEVMGEFSAEEFVEDAMNGLGKLELKERVLHLIDVLHNYLPVDFVEAADVLYSIREKWDWGDEKDALSGFAAWPLIDYVGVYGLEYPEKSLDVLRHLTPLFSAEFSIRPFIVHHGKLSEKILLKWCRDKDNHVRRLVSEGSRPRLPWGIRLQKYCEDPSPVLKLLERLKSDKSEYVRRSVANNLNDISKDHPDLVLKICRDWLKEGTKETQWIVRHATRSLVKAGHQGVFRLLGFSASPKLSLGTIKLAKSRLKMGDKLNFSIKLNSKAKRAQRLAIDYAIHHTKANGKLSAKVFKWKVLTLGKGESIEISKAHLFTKITTRKYYKGRHQVEVLINGRSYGSNDFHLSV